MIHVEHRTDRWCETFLAEGDEPPLGAHLVTPRLGFTHHGIYVGEMKVIHYGTLHEPLRLGSIEEVSLTRFRRGHSVWIRVAAGGCYSRREVVARARSRLGENHYRLISNNCEHFCEWCLNGDHRSNQIENASSWLRPLLRGFDMALKLLAAVSRSTLPCAAGRVVRSSGDELLATVDVVGRAGECRVAHDVNG